MRQGKATEQSPEVALAVGVVKRGSCAAAVAGRSSARAIAAPAARLVGHEAILPLFGRLRPGLKRLDNRPICGLVRVASPGVGYGSAMAVKRLGSRLCLALLSASGCGGSDRAASGQEAAEAPRCSESKRLSVREAVGGRRRSSGS